MKPFGGLFEKGMPCLMYHKIGPRPRGVRIKGLYVAPPLFERQLAELCGPLYRLMIDGAIHYGLAAAARDEAAGRTTP